MKKLLSILGCICLLIGLLGIFVSADAEEPLLVDIQFSAKKDTYDAGDTIQTTLEIKNNYDYPITNLTVLVDAPEGYQVEDPEALPAGSGLDAGKKASLSVKLVPEGTTPFNWGLLWTIVGSVIAGIAVIAVVVILILRKKLKAKAVVSMLLVSITLSGMATMWVQADAAEIARHSVTKEISLTLDGKPQTVTATVNFDTNPLADEITLDTTQLSYSETQKKFLTTPDFDGFFGTLKNPRAYTEIYLEVYDGQDHLLWKNSVAATKNWGFEQVPLCPGINRIRITAAGNTPLTLQLDLIDLYGKTFQLLEGYDVDTDGDEIPDLVENSLGTDPEKVDTDEDGLTDYEEMTLGTNPLKADSDDNGTPDGQDDYDNDGISNADELKKGLSPILADTDRDGIDDNDELKKHKTDPLKADSDGDGASDGWELENGYKPGKEEKSFSLSAQTAPVSELNPVSASVSLKVSGKDADVESLGVTGVSVADNPYISSCIAGYLGTAYDFTLDGTFDSATLTFRYDTSLGELGEDFQPRICYFNPDTNCFEVLPDQTVKDGVVTAKTTHFSIYALLNWSEMMEKAEAAYNEFAKSETEEYLESLATADIAIVMDASASMAWNDPADKSKEVAHYFIDHIREKFDKVSVLSYTYDQTLVQPLTSDKDALRKAVDSIALDNGVNLTSGTNGFAAINAAMDSIRGGGSAYRYILFFSDGDDKLLEKNYSSLIARANDADVKLLTVGIHTTGSSYLKTLAHKTGGQYYILDENLDVEKAFGHAISVFDAITPTEEDSNNDGLSDFVTKMIYEGKITLQNGDSRLAGADFNYDVNGKPSNDWDGDGLKNGEEIRLTYNPITRNIFLNMCSDPRSVDTDLDGLTDYEEYLDFSDPTSKYVHASPVDYLTGDNFNYLGVLSTYDRDSLPKGAKWLANVNMFFLNLDSVVFTFNPYQREETYEELMADYYLKYAKEIQPEIESNATLNLVMDVLDMTQAVLVNPEKKATDLLDKGAKPWNTMKDLHKCVYQISHPDLKSKALDDESSAAFLKKIPELVDKLGTKIPVNWKGADKVKAFLNKAKGKVPAINDFAEDIDKASKIFGYIDVGLDVVGNFKSLARIEAECESFTSNIDALEYVSKYAKDDYAKSAADLLITQIYGELGTDLGLAFVLSLRDVLKFGFKHVIDAGKKVPVAGLFVTILEIVIVAVDFIFKISKQAITTFKIMCYDAMATAYIHLLSQTPRHTSGNFFSITSEARADYLRRAGHLAKIRWLAEDQCYELSRLDACGLNTKALQNAKEAIDLSKKNIDEAAEVVKTGRSFSQWYISDGSRPHYTHNSRGGGGGGGHGNGR